MSATQAGATAGPHLLAPHLLAMPAAGKPAAQPPRNGSRAQGWVFGVALLLALAAAYTAFMLSERQDALRKVSRYNLSWTAGQAAQEVLRLQAALGAFAVTQGEVERDSVELWLDMVANRIAVLRRGESGAFIRSNPELSGIVDELAGIVDAARPLVARLDEPETVAQMMRSFQRVNPRMARLTSLAHGHGAALSASDAEELDHLYWRFCWLLLGLVACCLTLVASAAWRNRLLGRANAEVRSLVDNLTQAGQSLEAANQRVRDGMVALTEQNAVLHERDAELRRQNQLFDAALNNMSQGLGMFDAKNRLIVCNRRFAELFQLPPGVAEPGAHAAEILDRAGGSGGFGAAATDAVWAEHRQLVARSRAATFVREDEEGRSLWVSHRPMADGGWVATYEDVTETRQAEARIRYLANHDPLTGLPNRRQFHERLAEALGTLGRDVEGTADAAAATVAVLLLDLDHFKKVNDTLGHHAGDELLRAAVERIRGCLRDEDLVARLGGDEFAVLLRGDVTHPDTLSEVACRVASTLAEPFDLERFKASIGSSIGIAIAAEPGAANADTLLKHADVALYRAKAAGRGTHRIFEASMAAELQSRIEMECDLRAALEREELAMHYQPLFDLRRGRLSGFEALMRWRHPERGMVSPGEFIPVAEETGLIVPIGAWALRRACEEAAAFPEPVKVAVNISAVQFAGDDLPKLVRSALAHSGLAPHRLELEITESVILQDSDTVAATLRRIRELGVCVALDDFGTKYSSLGYLRSFPFDKIKIDQSFVRDMGTREDCHAIVHLVAHLAARLGMTATAEGVEDAEHLEQVREAGCTEAQGWFLGRPGPSESLGQWFRPRLPALVVNG